MIDENKDRDSTIERGRIADELFLNNYTEPIFSLLPKFGSVLMTCTESTYRFDFGSGLCDFKHSPKNSEKVSDPPRNG